MFKELSSDLDFGEVRINGTNMRASACGEKGGAETSGLSRSGPTTKMAALVDALGRLSRFALLAGRRHESLAVPGLSFGALLAALGA